MASKKSRSKTKKRSWPIIWLILSLVSGGGVSGYFNPGWPVIGPLVSKLCGNLVNLESQRGNSNQSQGWELPSQNQVPSQPASYGGNSNSHVANSQRPADKLLISSFNIQVFGKSKIAKNDVMSVIVQVIRQFDIVAIQEIRSKEDDILAKLIALLNADGSRYDYLIGPRLGRTVSTEQYAFIFDTQRVEYDPSSVGTMGDPGDLLHREPMVARFRPRTADPDKAFSFWLVNTHTDPDEVPEEVAALAQVFQVMRGAHPDEDDVILLGDLNASEFKLGPIREIPGINWVVRNGVMTNTRRNKAYDNIIFHGPSTNEFTGRWGVFDIENAFGLTRDQALQVSDHNPVWAEFQIWEGPPDRQRVGGIPAIQR